MTECKPTSINPLIADGDLHQTVVNCRSVTDWVANAIQECADKDLDYGQFLILQTVVGALRNMEDALDQAKRRLELVNG